MADVEHDAVYLRRMSTGNHMVAVDTGSDGPAYVEVPPVADDVPTHFGSQSKRVNRREDFAFGEPVRLSLSRRDG